MAIGSLYKAGILPGSVQVTAPGSALSAWTTAYDDAETVTGQTLNHTAITDSVFHWVEVPSGCTRVLVRAKYAVGATVTTSPIIYVVGGWGPLNENGSAPTDGTFRTMRLDTTDSNGTGITLTLVSSGTGQIVDGTYAYSDPPSLDGYDLKGAKYVGIVVATAANVNSGTVPIEILPLT